MTWTYSEASAAYTDALGPDTTSWWHRFTQETSSFKSHFCLRDVTVNPCSQPNHFLLCGLYLGGRGDLETVAVLPSIYIWHFFQNLCNVLIHSCPNTLMFSCSPFRIWLWFSTAVKQGTAKRRYERLCCDGQIREALQTKDFRQVRNDTSGMLFQASPSMKAWWVSGSEQREAWSSLFNPPEDSSLQHWCGFIFPRRSSSRMLTSFIFPSQQLGSDLWPLPWLFVFLMLIEPDFHKTDPGNFHGSHTVANQLASQLDMVRLQRCPWLL